MIRKRPSGRLDVTIRFKAFKNGKWYLDTTKHSKQRILEVIQANTAENYMISVVYDKKLNIRNEGEYTNKRELLKAYRAFTANDLIKDTYLSIQNNEW